MDTLHLLLPLTDYEKLKTYADSKQVSVSWLLRFMLFNPKKFSVPNSALKRPAKIEDKTKRHNLILFDDKSYWLAFVRYAYAYHVIGIEFKDEDYWQLQADIPRGPPGWRETSLLLECRRGC